QIVSALEVALPQVITYLLYAQDIIDNLRVVDTYNVSVSFGQYANPSFETLVETLGTAYEKGIMSLKVIVDELHGDSMTAEERDEEVKRLERQEALKLSSGVSSVPEVTETNKNEG